MDWWSYQYNEIMLSRDFVALDSNSKEISKETFLKELSEGSSIPIRLESDKKLFITNSLRLSPLQILVLKR
jgi:hypothetical protein